MEIQERLGFFFLSFSLLLYLLVACCFGLVFIYLFIYFKCIQSSVSEILAL